MSHWCHKMIDGAKFWISCWQLAFLSILSRQQLIQDLVPSTILWCQCDIRIDHWYESWSCHISFSFYCNLWRLLRCHGINQIIIKLLSCNFIAQLRLSARKWWPWLTYRTTFFSVKWFRINLKIKEITQLADWLLRLNRFNVLCIRKHMSMYIMFPKLFLLKHTASFNKYKNKNLHI